MFLGIEIGGTKLQLGVGAGDGSTPVALSRVDVDAAAGAVGILSRIESEAAALVARFPVRRIGIGFGGPINPQTKRIIRSHQIEGWHDFPLEDWCQRTFKTPTVIGNDCDVAALAEARFGAGRGRRVVFFVTVGTGVGGGLVIDGQIYHGSGLAVAEIGHMRPGLHAERPDDTVESIVSGPGIAASAQSRLAEPMLHPFPPLGEPIDPSHGDHVRQRVLRAEEVTGEFAADLLARAEGRIENVTSKLVAQAAGDGNQLAIEILQNACGVLGWAIAQVITIVAPQLVVVGGGVSQIGESLFLAPLRSAVERYVFPPLLQSYEILPAALGEQVVLHGALALAANGEPIAIR